MSVMLHTPSPLPSPARGRGGFAHALRDLRGGARQLKLFILCLLIGVAVMACIGSVVASIKAGILRDAKSLTGGDIEVSQLYQPLSDEAIAYLQFQGPVARTQDMRTMASANGKRTLIDLKAVTGAYPLYGALKLEPDISTTSLFLKRKNKRNVAVDRTLASILEVGIGDQIHIGEADFTINALIEREPDRSVTFFALGSRVLTSMEGFAATDLIQYGSMINYRYKVKLPEGTDLAVWKKELRERFPESTSWNIREWKGAAPSFSNLLDRLMLFFALTGLTTLITAGIGIGNAAHGYLWSKRGTIATLKCLGATQAHIYRMYAMQLGIIATVTIAAGLIAGIALEALLLHFFSSMLPVQGAAGVYLKPLALAAGFGFLIVALFSILPLKQTALVKPAALFRGNAETPSLPRRSTPRNNGIITYAFIILLTFALTGLAIFFTESTWIPIYFTIGVAISMAAFSGISHLFAYLAKKSAHHGRKSLTRVMALSNLSRPGSATSSITIALGIGISVLITLSLVGGNLREQVESGLPEKAPAFYLVDIPPDEAERLKADLQKVDTVSHLSFTPMVRGRITALNGVAVNPDTVAEEARWAVRGDRGVTWAATAPQNARIVRGEWWPDNYSGPPLVSFDAKLARGMNLTIGDTITISSMGYDYTAKIHNLRDISWGTLEMNFATILSPGAVPPEVPVTYLATVNVTGDGEKTVQHLLDEEYPAVSVVRIRDALANVSDLLKRASRAVFITASFTILCGALVMASAINASLSRRIYDTVMLKVLGISRKAILRIYLLEFALIAFFVSFAAIAVGIAGAYGIMQLMIFSAFRVMPEIIAITLLFALLLAVVIGLTSTRRALAVRPLDYLRNE